MPGEPVFVVASAQRWTPANSAELDVNDAFKVCTAESIAVGGVDAGAGLVLYRGASPGRPVGGMYSFVPALPVDGDEARRFARPSIRLPGLIDPTNMQSMSGSRQPVPFAALREAWGTVREQVLAAGLGLAVAVDTPPEHNQGRATPTVSTAACRSSG